MVSAIKMFWRMLFEKIEYYRPLRSRFKDLNEHVDDIYITQLELQALTDQMNKDMRRLLAQENDVHRLQAAVRALESEVRRLKKGTPDA